jgi:hypothetical protein
VRVITFLALNIMLAGAIAIAQQPAGLTNPEPTALAAGVEGGIHQPSRPDASADGSQKNTDSSAQQPADEIVVKDENAAPDETTAETSAETVDSAEPTVALPNRWLLLCCGLPGDEEHRERLTQACEQIISAAELVLGVAPERLRLLVGDEEMRDALADQAKQIDVSTKESVAAMLQDLSQTVQDEDACWIVLMGHAHLYGGSSQFNVLDEDFDQTEFAGWAKPLACSEQVFWITTPVSGFWIKPLSGVSRIVISATEPDLEYTGTEMPYALADLLTGAHEEQPLDDIDKDGSLSLLDLYLAVNLEIQGRFASMERLQTEHAQLDDNGDGRGSEVQQAYLPEEVEESEDDPEPADDAEAAAPTVQTPEPITNQNVDGYRSRQVVIRSPAETEI